MQKMYKGLENKIISLQQRIDELNKNNNQLKQRNAEIPELKTKLDVMKQLEIELKSCRAQLTHKENQIFDMSKQLELERDEKMSLLEERDREEKEWNKQKQLWRIENQELKTQVHEMIEMAKKEAIVTSTSHTRLLSEVDNNDIQQAYQRALNDKEKLENDNYLLRDQLQRLQRQHLPNSDFTTNHSRSISNASSNNNEEDFGYASAKNTLDLRRQNVNDDGLSEFSTPESIGKQSKIRHSFNKNIVFY